ncbi:hypothetical protein NPIL_149711 [Nephila pilipes]|uniref:Uncharacterized protein n=1 Tax=Nephila pilipes TaxID=299642 RepID=A0A8X6NWY1_NEPPI|nr:hypothetical protein NPIL_149711 [Nephila pilipes]
MYAGSTRKVVTTQTNDSEIRKVHPELQKDGDLLSDTLHKIRIIFSRLSVNAKAEYDIINWAKNSPLHLEMQEAVSPKAKRNIARKVTKTKQKEFEKSCTSSENLEEGS